MKVLSCVVPQRGLLEKNIEKLQMAKNLLEQSFTHCYIGEFQRNTKFDNAKMIGMIEKRLIFLHGKKAGAASSGTANSNTAMCTMPAKDDVNMAD